MNHMKHNNEEKKGTLQIQCAPNILCVIGKSPLIQIGRVYAKLETTNPSGSVKDRMAHYMADKAKKSGALKPGSRIIEVTSGNTGIAFAMIAAHRGYRFTAVMPASMSLQRRHMMEAFKAEMNYPAASHGVSKARQQHENHLEASFGEWTAGQSY